MALAPASRSAASVTDQAGDRLDRLRDTGQDSGSQLDRLTRRPGALDRLVADAGPLGRFLVARDDALPAGTSAYTKRGVDMLAGIEAKLGLPRERVLATATFVQPLPGTVLPQATVTPGVEARQTDRTLAAAPRPDIAVDAGNTAQGGIAGNPSTVRA